MSIDFKTKLLAVLVTASATTSFAAQTVSLNRSETQFSVSKGPSFGLDSRNSFKVVSETVAKTGAKNTRMSQYFDGLRVIDHTAVVGTDSAGNVNRLHGYVAQGIEMDIQSTQISITEEQAIALAKAAHSEIYRVSQDWRFRDLTADKGIFLNKAGKAVVVFNVQFFVEGANSTAPSRPNVMINGNTGAIESYRDALAFADAEATGPGGNQKTGKYQYGTDFPALAATSDANSVCHFSTTNVKTVDVKNEGTGNPQQDDGLNTVPHSFPCSENTDRAINGAFSPLNDAQSFGGTVFKMYHDWYGVNPLKTDLTLRVHYGKEFENAFWDGKQMTFGDGKDMFYPLVVLDVTAHEVSHGFTEFNSKLTYSSHAGGINESFSDIAGEAAEFFARGHNDFLVGSEVMKTGVALRYMDDPTKDHNSITRVSDFKEPTDEMGCLFCRISGGGAACAEMCGTDVHHSSGVFNKVFYAVATSPGWTTRKAFDVFVKANQSYWTEQTTFQDGAAGVIHAATDLGYSTAEFKLAFTAAGINL
jgi:vibriolysin